MKVTVLTPFQVCHDGRIYRPGDRADVPDEVAKGWLVSVWVEPADAAAKKVKASIDASLANLDPVDEVGRTAAGDVQE
jgi:hypothetical protein